MATTRSATRWGTNALPLQFTIGVLAISWAFWWPAAFIEQGALSLPIPSGILTTLGALGPLVTALIMIARDEGTSGVRKVVSQVIQWRVSPLWWTAAIVGPLGLTLAGIGVHIILGGTPPDALSLAEYTLAALITAVYMIFFVALGEEVGWRGYLLPSLQVTFNALWSSVIVGMIWAVWHLPLFYNPAMLYSRLPFPLWVAFLVPFAILLTWVYNSSRGSLLLVILMHAMMNGASAMWKSLPDMERLGSVSPYEANVLVNSLLTAVLIVAAIVVALVYGPANLSRTPRQTLASGEHGEPRV